MDGGGESWVIFYVDDEISDSIVTLCIQAVRLLLAWRGKSRHVLVWGRRSFNVNEKYIEGQTALDMYILQHGQTQEGDNGEMRVILDGAGALTASSMSIPTVTSSYYTLYLRLPVICEEANNRRKAQCVAGGCCTACNIDLSSDNHPSWGTLARWSIRTQYHRYILP